MAPAYKLALWAAVLTGGCFFFVTSFRKGWTRVETDFPNYYTAAVLARQHQPLERYYDWPWFQRHMNYTGTERQLGGYIPQTPLTMLPFVPLSGLPPQRAKQVWLALNVVFLGVAAVLLARLMSGAACTILLLALAGYPSLDANFLLGQYYVFLLFGLTVGVWLLLRGRAFGGGFVMGAICMLKLYSAPFLLYFLWKRQWRALAGMLTACAGLAALAVGWFGLKANLFYLTYVFPRASENAILDPYHPAIGTLTNLLRRSLVPEPELNPHPWFDAPAVFFFLRPLLTLLILVLPLLTMRRDKQPDRRELAWFLIAILFFSPNTALYAFVVLLLPVALLLHGANRPWTAALATAYILLSLPLRPGYSWLFPKVWILLALFVLAGSDYWRRLRWRPAVAAAMAIAVFAFADAARRQRSYEQEPARKFTPVELQEHSVYASRPSVSKAGIVFETMGQGGYVLNRTMAFDGHVFHPSTPAPGFPIYFELVANGHSRVVSFNPATKSQRTLVMDATDPAISPDGMQLAYLAKGRLLVRGWSAPAAEGPVDGAAWFPDGAHLAFSGGGAIYDSRDGRRIIQNVEGELSDPAVSPDGEALAFTATRRGIRHVWMEDLTTRRARELTGGACNSYAAAWEPDSRGLIFASDCSRGLGLPRLYRADVRNVFSTP